MEAYAAISIGLYDQNRLAKKQWNKDDLEFDDNKVICPLTPEETKDFPPVLTLAMKVLSDEGKIIFFKEEPLRVSGRLDKGVVL